MSNEELVLEIQSGAADRMEELWEQVEYLVKWKANQTMNALESCPGRGVEFDDLCQTGYIAMVAAVESYDISACAFSTWLVFHLKSAFAEVTGYRTKKGRFEPLNNALSLDKPLNDESDSALFGDLLPDMGAAAAMEAVEECVFQKQLHEALEAALKEIPERFGNVLRMRYFQNMTLVAVGKTQGICAERVRKMEGSALKRMRKMNIVNQLRPFVDFDFYCGTGLGAFRNTGMSVQERYLLTKEE